MKIGRRFNQMSLRDCFAVIENHKKYTDFNTLGLYRSILENQRFTLEEKIELREYAHRFFKKSFDFLRVKDPHTFIKVNTLGKDLTEADEHQAWVDVWAYQNKILTEKKIKHRSFGEYSKHNCGYDDCPYNGIMIQQGSPLAEMEMRGQSWTSKEKSNRRLSDRKQQKSIIKRILEIE